MVLTTPSVLTLGDVARRLGCATWQVRRLFERGTLPATARTGRYRVIGASDLPLIEEALKQAGYLTSSEVPSRAA